MTDLLSARLFAPLALTAITALGLLLWILRNGDLCPGQRRRISDGLISVWTVFGLALMLSVEAGVPDWMLWLGGATLALGLGAVLYQARLAGKRSLSLNWHWPALILALCYGLGLLLREGPAALLMAGAGGCVFTHLILVRARHRLQAFNLLLPLVGIGFAIGWMMLLLVQTLWSQHESVSFDSSHLIMPFAQMCAAILLGAIVWLLPLLRKEPTKPPVIAVAALLVIGALTVGQSIIWQLSVNIN